MNVNRLRDGLSQVPDVTPVTIRINSMVDPYEMTAGELRHGLGRAAFEGKWTFPVGVSGLLDYPPFSERYPDSRWQKTNGVAVLYVLSGKSVYHTGDDLNLPGTQDIGEPVHAPAAGQVTFAGYVPNSTWGNVLVMRLVVDDKTFVYTRFAHLNSIEVKTGDTVAAGQVVAYAGNVGMPDVPHLHWDMTKENDPLLGNSPRDWPGENLAGVQAHYIDPGKYVASKMLDANEEPVPTEWRKVDAQYLRIRSAPGLSTSVLSLLPAGSILEVETVSVAKDGYNWVRIVTATETPNVVGGYAAVEFLSALEIPPAEKRVVSTVSLNIRSGPGTSYAIQDTLVLGTVVYVTDKVGTDLSAWRKLADGRGWIAEWLTRPF